MAQVLKIAKSGYDVKTAGDVDLAFSSQWPSLPIAAEINTNQFAGNALIANPTVINIPHNLGFPPFTIGWTVVNGRSQTLFPDVDATNIYFNSSFPNPSTFGYCNFKCFNLDLTKDVDYPFALPPSPGRTGPVKSSKVFKLAKPHKDISSTDLRDYLIHSRCQSPQILAVKIGNNSNGGTLSYTSPLGYTSWVFGYVKGNTFGGTRKGRYGFAPYHSQAYPVTKIDNSTNTYSISYVAGDIAVLVILRDPMFGSTKLSVSY